MKGRRLHVEKANVRVGIMAHRFIRRDRVTATAFVNNRPVLAWSMTRARQAQIDTTQQNLPAFVFRRRGYYWVYQGQYYRANQLISCMDLFNIVANFDVAAPRVQGSTKQTWLRQPIPESVKAEVWKRDGGRCTKCASEVDLEFDHVIPVAEGGSNTSANNVQILCGTHNRKKGKKIAS